MDPDRRDQLNQLGSELAGILEEASVEAALLPGLTDQQCPRALCKLHEDVARARSLVASMQTLLSAEGSANPN